MKITNKTRCLSTRFLRTLTAWVYEANEITGDITAYWGLTKKGPGSQRVNRRSGDILGVWIDSPPLTHQALFELVLTMSAALRPSLVPSGELGKYRQPVLRTWTEGEAGTKLLAKLNLIYAEDTKIATPSDTTDPKIKRRAAKLRTAERELAKRQLRLKRIQTSVKFWERRVRALKIAMAKST